MNKAIKVLKEDILSEGDFFPGDLLISVLRLENSDWKGNAQLQTEFNKLLELKKSEIIAGDDKDILRQIEGYKNSLRTT